MTEQNHKVGNSRIFQELIENLRHNGPRMHTQLSTSTIR